MLRSRNGRFGGAGKLVLLGCGGLIVLAGAIVTLVFLLTGPQVKVLEAHLAAMRSKDVDTAFQYVDGQQITKDQLKAILDLNPQVFGGSDASFPSRNVANKNGQESAEIKASIQGTDGKTYSITYLLLPSGDDWKIAVIQSQQLVFAPATLAITGVKTSQKKLEDGRTELVVEFAAVGCATRKNGAKFDYDVVLKGKFVDDAGNVLLDEQEMKRVQATADTDGEPVTGKYTYTIPPGVSDIKATILVEDTISGKGVSQVVPVKLGQ